MRNFSLSPKYLRNELYTNTKHMHLARNELYYIYVICIQAINGLSQTNSKSYEYYFWSKKLRILLVLNLIIKFRDTFTYNRYGM